MPSVVWRVHHFDDIDSTNTWVADAAVRGEREGLVALADHQIAGRGRHGRTWESPARTALLCSLLLRPSIDLDDLQLVVAAVSLSVRDALVRLSGVRPDLKWPNDLVVGDAKLGGVLAEAVPTDDGLAVVVGVGVNLAWCPPGAASVSGLSGVTLVARGLLDIVLEGLDARLELLDAAPGRASLREEYERALATVGRRVRVELAGEAHEGEARGVDHVGRLVVEVGGATRTFSAGDVVHLRPGDA